MNKKIVYLVLVSIIGLLLIGFGVWQMNVVEKKETINLVKEYLLTKKGYKEEDILKIEGLDDRNAPEFQVVVVFRDEPDWRYTYQVKNGVTVYQNSFIIPDGKLPLDSKHKDVKSW